ncbi:putative amino-acid metabolite efflux pump [Candidatus Methylocalor cossyra]|uniref:Amino-acid metabolite efflux pump n=2 Tax=Candidatus Methylocalor cossyra TaxID=3108543 RepID=A0ABM9NJZ9_9GAMM
MPLRDIGLAMLVVTIWGANFTVIKLGLEGVPPMLFAALRYVFAALPAVFFVRPPSIPAHYWVIYGLTVGIGLFGCLFYAIHIGMPAGLASVVVQAQALFTLLFAAVVLREAISVPQLVGLGLAVVGLYLIGYNPGEAGTWNVSPSALLWTLTGAAFWGISNIVVRKASTAAIAKNQQLDMFSLVVWSSLVPPIPLFLLALLLDTQDLVFKSIVGLNEMSWSAILYLAFGATLLGFSAWSHLLSKHPANRVAPLSLFVPVTGLCTASLVLDERLSSTEWLGCLFVLFGLIVATVRLPKLLRVTADGVG